jgi:hypothetical protein
LLRNALLPAPNVSYLERYAPVAKNWQIHINIKIMIIHFMKNKKIIEEIS